MQHRWSCRVAALPRWFSKLVWPPPCNLVSERAAGAYWVSRRLWPPVHYLCGPAGDLWSTRQAWPVSALTGIWLQVRCESNMGCASPSAAHLQLVREERGGPDGFHLSHGRPSLSPLPQRRIASPRPALKKRPAIIADPSAGPSPAPCLFFCRPVSRCVFFSDHPGRIAAFHVSYLCLLLGSCLFWAGTRLAALPVFFFANVARPCLLFLFLLFAN